MEQLKTGFLVVFGFRSETRLFRPTVRTKGRYKSNKKQKKTGCWLWAETQSALSRISSLETSLERRLHCACVREKRGARESHGQPQKQHLQGTPLLLLLLRSRRPCFSPSLSLPFPSIDAKETGLKV